MRRFLHLLAVVSLLLGGAARGSSNPPAVAVLPFENLTLSAGAPSAVSRSMADALAKKGWRVLDGVPVEAALDAARVRYLDSPDPAARAKLNEALGSPTLAVGSILAWDAAADPRVAFSVTLTGSDGKVLFSDLVSLRAEDANGAFQYGRPVSLDDVAAEAVRRIASRLPRPGASPGILPRRRLPVHLPAPRTFRSASLAAGARHRVVVLPFANAGPHEAARIVGALFARRLAASSLFDAVPPAELRAAFVAEKIHDVGDPAERMRLGKRLGTTLYLTGTIYEFSEANQAASDTPLLEMEATLIDASTGEMLWTSYVTRLGTQYRGLLELGEIHGIVGLADQSVAEMIRAAEKASPTRSLKAAAQATPFKASKKEE